MEKNDLFQIGVFCSNVKHVLWSIKNFALALQSNTIPLDKNVLKLRGNGSINRVYIYIDIILCKFDQPEA